MSTQDANEKPRRHNRPHIPAQPLDDLAALAIREMEARGDWHLPGKGKPLRLVGSRRDVGQSARRRRFSSPWEDVAREIEFLLRDARTQLKRAHGLREAALGGAASKKRHANMATVETDWQRALDAFEKQIGSCNCLILKFNLLIPPQIPQLRYWVLRC